MKTKLVFAVFLSLFFALAGQAQVFLKVNEAETKAKFENNQLQTNLVVENSANSPVTSCVKLEILDADDQVLAQSETGHKLSRAKQSLLIPVSFSAAAKTDELLWKRLRYTVSVENTNASVSNVVSLSEIMPEVFELQVSAPENVYPGMNLRAHVLALHPFTHKPVRNIEITGEVEVDIETDADEDEITVKARGSTNAEGFASLEFKIPEKVKIDDGDMTIKGVKNGIVREADQDLDAATEALLYLNTDKPIYQPAQKLFIRGLYLDAQKRPQADQDLDFEIRDENYRTVYEGTAKTSRFGVVNVEWQIPADLRLGNYKVEFETDDGDEVGKSEFKVSRYELPNFTVNAKASKSFYLPGETAAQVTVDAAYLFGKPVASGRVRVVREKERSWNYSRQRYDTEEGESIEGETDAEGKFTARVDLSEAQKNLNESGWKRFDDVKFAAYLTDPTTNRTEQRRFDVRLTKEAIHVYFIRRADDPNPKLPFLFYVSTFYADGTPAKCDLKIDGNYRYTTLQTKIAEGKTNSYGAGRFEARFPEKPFADASSEFSFRISADDRKGNRGLLEDNIYLDANKRQLRLRTDKTIYLPDQSIDLKVFSSENEQTVYVDVLKNSSVIYSKGVRITDARGNLSIPFRPDFKGELQIAAYFRDEDGDPVVASKTVLYPSPTNLNLNLKSLKTTYRPNEDAKITFSVQNGEKRPSEVALGVLVLDKAIEERARTEQLPDNFAGVRKLLGTADAFGNLTRRDLDNLDLAKPLDADLQLAAEFLLVNNTYEPNFFESDSFQDDFSRIYKAYFNKKLAKFERILIENYEKTGDSPRDESEVRRLLSAVGVNFEDLRDAWEMPFRTGFNADRSHTVLMLRTAGADKKFGTEDDFTATEMRFEWFQKSKINLTSALNEHLEKGNSAPQTEEELKALWKTAGYDFNDLHDGWNRPFQLVKVQYNRRVQKMTPETVGNLDGERQQVLRSRTVEQKVDLYRLWSGGADGAWGGYDDFEVAAFTIVHEEKELPGEQSKTEIFKTQSPNAKGAVGGKILDPNGAVVPGAQVSAENTNSAESFSGVSDENGEFMLTDLPSGKYKITAQSPGFQNYVVENVVVSSMNLITLSIMLEVGTVSATVDVTSSQIQALETSSATKTVTRSEAKSIVANFENGRNAPSFTPRVREYFPETLLWQPELITDKNGRAALNFKLGDNLTTWKLYAVASTETGEINMVEKEFQTFQPFFAELDPPRVLTEGDRIDLPVPVRNYTDRRQRVAVSMTENSWSKILNGAAQNIEIAPNSTANAVFNFEALAPVTDARQKVTALARGEGDAIEKPITVRPNGREFIRTASDLFEKEAAFDVDYPANAFRNTRQTQIKIYPNMFAHVAESIEGLLQRPHGCGEQTTSSTYPNLLILKIEKDLKKGINPNLKKRAREFLDEGYERLLNYQTASGGFSFWGKTDPPNTALTAYILRFLHDAESFTEVDDRVVERAENWLIAQQKADGSWEPNRSDQLVTTAYILRSLTLTAENDAPKRKALQAAIEFLKKRLDKTENSFVLANLALAALETGDAETARAALEKLENLARSDDSVSQYWTTESTPFYGWGTTANIETTALVVQAFLRFTPPSPDPKYQGYVARGLSYLLKNKDRYGVWYSTQTTVNALDALILFQKLRLTGEMNNNNKAEIFINGKKAQEFSPSENALTNPFIFDASTFLTEDKNRIEIKTSGDLNLTMAQIVTRYFVDWDKYVDPGDTHYFDLKIDFDKLQAKPAEEITCRVRAQRKNNQYGMVLTEIGLPPGADVDRGSLERAKSAGIFSSFDVLPDRIVVYSWMGSQPLEFGFKFRPRFGLNAQTAPSQIYDYYNEEARATLPPARFEVK